MTSSSNPHISLNPGCSHLIRITSQNLTEVVKNEFGVALRYVESRIILDGQFTSSRASESANWQELRKDLERGWDGSKKPELRITT